MQYLNTSFPGGLLNPGRLKDEILASGIVTALGSVDTVGGSVTSGVVSGSYTASVSFKAALPQADRLILDGADQGSVEGIQSDDTLAPASGTTDPSVLDIQTDATLDPGASPAIGDRYLLLDASNLHANFGTPSASDNDVVEWDGALFIVSPVSEDAKLQSLADSTYRAWDGSTWNVVGAGVTGYRYLILNANNLHSNFGALVATDNDIVEFNGTEFVVVVIGASAKIQDKADRSFHAWNGSAWSPATVGGLIAAHDNSPTPSVYKPKLNADGVALSSPQPQTLGYEMCERDFKIVTCQMAQAAAVEDLKQNPATLKEDLWAGPELSIVGVYKDVAGSMVLCDDQGDANTNGILTIWDYKAIDQADGTTEIPYDIRSGALIPDPLILPSDRFNHRAYIMVAPDLGQANYVRLFDGYVAGRPVEGELSTDSPSGKKLDPALAPGANVVRIYVHHPAGITHSHILYLMTYRPKGTF